MDAELRELRKRASVTVMAETLPEWTALAQRHGNGEAVSALEMMGRQRDRENAEFAALVAERCAEEARPSTAMQAPAGDRIRALAARWRSDGEETTK